MDGTQTLDLAYEELQQELPRRAARALIWLRSAHGRWARIPLGVVCIVCGLFWFLPVLGIQFLPIGLLLLAQDVPRLRKPVARFVLYAVSRWRRLKRWFRTRCRDDEPR
jgi:hypothetical protein